MTADIHPALLPNGLSDQVPPHADTEWRAVNRLLETYAAQGYQLVKPPLMEFETGLLSGPGAALASQTFRLMDPISQRMLGLRADITAQIARIAGSRLQKSARPLRLSYAGEVVRVAGSQLRPERQFCQVGAELIGALDPAADAEVITMAVSALQGLELSEISLDLCLPTLLPHFLAESGLTGEALAALDEAVRRRDREAVAGLASPVTEVLVSLLAATGPVDQVLDQLVAISVPSGLVADIRRLLDVVELVRHELPALSITIDPLERRGFEYQTGLSFTLFARGVRGELGRGGRYRSAGVAPAKSATGASDPPASASERMARLGEPAVGFSLFMDSIMRALPDLPPARRILVPGQLPLDRRQALLAEGWTIIRDHDWPADNQPDQRTVIMARARGQHCSHFLVAGTIEPV